MVPRFSFMLAFLLCSTGPSDAQSVPSVDSSLTIRFDRGYGQVEVSGRYVGIEFHESRPLPSRISFYYPVANSIDLSTDYWRRGESRPMVVGVRVGTSAKRPIGNEPWEYTLAPHAVVFRRREDAVEYSISYEFCFNKPALVMSLTIKNISSQSLNVEVYTHLRTTLRTCQTYARKDTAWTEYDSLLGLIATHFDEPDADSASVFVQNVGMMPSAWTSSAQAIGATEDGTAGWLRSARLDRKLLPRTGKGVPVAAFAYTKDLQPGDSLLVRQVIGSCRRDELKKTAQHLAAGWSQEVNAYNEYVRRKAGESEFVTGDPWLDRTALWARALLAANAHYLDGNIVPMPCPAEYNFFFTHDLLLTDLGAVNFDLERVRSDLLYLHFLSRDNIIPHAYYWRDDGFKTEFCTPSNWNHLWFVLVVARYLRHSMDETTVRQLFPLVSKSVEEVLTQKKEDNLMYAFRPDWWDIGWNEGPRAYITILTIRALREYLFICSVLDERTAKLLHYEQLADSMQQSLVARLWDEQSGYLINYNGPYKDNHYYAGSLLAATYGLLSPDWAIRLVETATKELVDTRIGVRTVSPADFHTDSLKSFFKFAGNEAGDPYFYINGGVWPHTNAWYALALHGVNRTEEAVNFVKRVMTLDGVLQSPLGQPAFYEYRHADASSREYGKVDKPSFLWAGGMYLHTLYSLFGVAENEWNLSLVPPPSGYDMIRFTLDFGERKSVVVKGKEGRMRSVTADGTSIPSLALPLSLRTSKRIEVQFGVPTDPYLERVNALLHTVGYNHENRKLDFKISSFAGHGVTAVVVSKARARVVMVEGRTITPASTRREQDGVMKTEIRFTGSNGTQKVVVFF